MPEKLYETWQPDSNIGGSTFSFNKEDITQIAADNDSAPVSTHYAHAFFEEEAQIAAAGDTEHTRISKRELIELFAELYKV